VNLSTSDSASGSNAGEMASPVASAAPSRSTERVLWWIAVGVLTFGAVVMLGLWN
jgi:hypothetical protein